MISRRCRIIYLTSESAFDRWPFKCFEHLLAQPISIARRLGAVVCRAIAPVVSAEAVSGLMAHNGEKHG